MRLPRLDRCSLPACTPPNSLEALWDSRATLLQSPLPATRQFGEQLGLLHLRRQFGDMDRATFRHLAFALQAELDEAVQDTAMLEGDYLRASADLRLQVQRLSQPRPESRNRPARRAI